VSGERLYVGEPVTVQTEVYLNGIRPEEVRVEIYAGPIGQDGGFSQRKTMAMTPVGTAQDGWQTYRGQALPADAGRYGFTVRILPHHPLLLDPHSLGLIRWASE
jgi:starch phosphorylase